MEFDRNLIFTDYFDRIGENDFALFDLETLKRKRVGDVPRCHGAK